MTQQEQEALKVVGANVRRLRTGMHMTQAALATAAEVAQPTICSLEKGEKDFTIGLIARIADALGEPVDTLFRSEKATAVEKSATRRLTA